MSNLIVLQFPKNSKEDYVMQVLHSIERAHNNGQLIDYEFIALSDDIIVKSLEEEIIKSAHKLALEIINNLKGKKIESNKENVIKHLGLLHKFK